MALLPVVRDRDVTERFVPVPLSHPTPVGQGATTPERLPGRRPVARPHGLTQDVEARYMTVLRSTGSKRNAAEASGLNPGTVDNWVRRGEGRLKDRTPTPEYVRFARLFRENIAAARSFATANLLAQSGRSPRAATNWLDVYGDDEWKDARRAIREGDDRPLAPAPVQQQAVQVNVGVQVDSHDQNLTVIEIPDDQMPDFIRGILAQSRKERDAIVAANETDMVMEQAPDGYRSPRLNRLRASTT